MPRLLLFIAAITFAIPDVYGFDFDASVSYSGKYTNNTERSPDDRVEEFVHRPGISVGASHEGVSTSLNAGYAVTRRIHEKDSFDDDTVATGSASLRWQAVPERLSFFASNSRTDTTIDSRAADNPANQQTVGYTSAGSNLTFGAIANHRVDLGYLFGTTDAEETDTNSDRQTGTLAYIVPLTAGRQASLSGSYTDVDFDNEFSPDYQALSGSVNFNSSTRLLQFALSAGYQTTDRDLSESNVDGFIGSANATYTIDESSQISVRVARSIGDNFDAGARGTIDFIDEFPERTDTNGVYTLDSASVNWNKGFGSNDLTLSLRATDQNYAGSEEDEKALGASVTLSRRLTEATALTLTASLDDRKFEVSDRKNTSTRARLSYSINRWRALSLGFAVSYYQRDSDSSSVESDESDEWSGSVTLSYQIYRSRQY